MTLVLMENPVDLIETCRISKANFITNCFSLVLITDVSLQIIIPVGTPSDPSATNHLITTSTPWCA